MSYKKANAKPTTDKPAAVNERSGGANIDADRVDVSGDVVGRDKNIKITVFNDRTNRAWLYVLAGIVGLIIIVLGIIATHPAAPASVTVIIPTNAPTATPLPNTPTATAPPNTPMPTATPIFNSSARYHVAIAKMNDQNATKKYSIEPRLEEDLRQALRDAGLSPEVDVRVVSQPTVDSESAAQDFATTTHSDIVVWGLYDDAGIRLSVLLGPQHVPSSEALSVYSVGELPVTSSGPQSGTESISFYITGTLPSDTKFLSLYVIGHLDYLANHYDEGRRAFDAAMKELPHTVQIENEALLHFFQARALPVDIFTDTDTIVCEYAKAIQLDPTMFEAYNNLGVVIMDHYNAYNLGVRTPRVDDCAHSAGLTSFEPSDFFSKALQIKPDLGVALSNLAALQWNAAVNGQLADQAIDAQALAERQQAQTKFEAALQADPSIAATHIALGNMAIWDGDFLKATNHYSAALQLDPSPEIMVNLGQALALAGRNTEAEAVYRQALQLAPQAREIQVEANLDFGSLYSQQGDTDGAYAEFQLVADLGVARERAQTLGLALLKNDIEAKNWVSVTQQLIYWVGYNSTITETWNTNYLTWLAGRNVGMSLPPTIPITINMTSPSFYAWTQGLIGDMVTYDLSKACRTPSADQRVCVYDQPTLEAVLLSSISERLHYRLFFNNMFLSGTIQACPYIFTFNAQQNEWQFDTTILYKLVGPQARATQERPLTRFDGRLWLQEVEPETSYVDTLTVRIITADGHEMILKANEPLLNSDDSQYLVLHQGDRHLFNFDLPPGALPVRQAWVIASGYYVPYSK